MGFLRDLVYYAPALGARGAPRIALAKIRKLVLKGRTRRALARAQDPEAFFRRLGLPLTAEARVAVLRERWNAYAPLAVPDLPPVEILRRAAEVLEGRQILFGAPCRVGWPPRWDWRWDGEPWAAEFSGDVRSTWELQRLQGVLPLAWAAHASEVPERERFAEAYVDALLSFHATHPGPHGLAWESALEVGLRLVSLAQGLPLVVHTLAFARRETAVLAILDRQARWLAADASLDKVLPGNHLLGELAGLLAADALLPGRSDAQGAATAFRVDLERQILRQFHPDGVSVEQSLPYEKFVLEFLTMAASLDAARGVSWSETVRRRLAAALDHLESATAPDGRLPLVGDNDSGRGAWWGEVDPACPRAVIARARRVFGGSGAPPPAGRRGGALQVHVFPGGGHLVARNAAGDYLFLRAGPFGWGSNGPASHSHADWLAPVLTLHGEPVLVDPGVYGYRLAPSLRDAGRDWPGHNGVCWNPPRSPRPAGTFRWTGFGARARLLAEGEGESESESVGGEVVWGGGKEALRWRRSIHYNELDGTWSIDDHLAGDSRGSVGWALHFAPGIRVESGPDEAALRIALPSGRRYLVRFEPPGRLIQEEGWVAPTYGRRLPAPVVHRELGGEDRISRIVITPEPRSMPGATKGSS